MFTSHVLTAAWYEFRSASNNIFQEQNQVIKMNFLQIYYTNNDYFWLHGYSSSSCSSSSSSSSLLCPLTFLSYICFLHKALCAAFLHVLCYINIIIIKCICNFSDKNMVQLMLIYMRNCLIIVYCTVKCKTFLFNTVFYLNLLSIASQLIITLFISCHYQLPNLLYIFLEFLHSI